jgi:hypothetical protein
MKKKMMIIEQELKAINEKLNAIRKAQFDLQRQALRSILFSFAELK